LKTEPKASKEDWDFIVYSNSNCAGDTENQLSITGFVICLLGTHLLEIKRTVSLSRSEAEYLALSEAAKEIRFLYYLLESLDISVKLTIIVRIDNIGAIFMAKNVSS
jgi:hypothetical protein